MGSGSDALKMLANPFPLCLYPPALAMLIILAAVSLRSASAAHSARRPDTAFLPDTPCQPASIGSPTTCARDCLPVALPARLVRHRSQRMRAGPHTSRWLTDLSFPCLLAFNQVHDTVSNWPENRSYAAKMGRNRRKKAGFCARKGQKTGRIRPLRSSGSDLFLSH